MCDLSGSEGDVGGAEGEQEEEVMETCFFVPSLYIVRGEDGQKYVRTAWKDSLARELTASSPDSSSRHS